MSWDSSEGKVLMTVSKACQAFGVTDEWAELDLPVLEAVRRIEARLPTGDACNVEDVSAEADIEDVRVLQLLYRLVTAGYLIGVPMQTDSGVYDMHITGLSERGRRAVGQWPSEDPWAGVIDLLSTQIAEEQDPVKRGKLQRFLEGVLSGGKTVGASA